MHRISVIMCCIIKCERLRKRDEFEAEEEVNEEVKVAKFRGAKGGRVRTGA